MQILLVFWQLNNFWLCCETIKMALKYIFLIYRKSRFYWHYYFKRDSIYLRGSLSIRVDQARPNNTRFITLYLGDFFIDSFSILSLICLNRFHSKHRMCTNWYKAHSFDSRFIHISDIYLIGFHSICIPAVISCFKIPKSIEWKYDFFFSSVLNSLIQH